MADAPQPRQIDPKTASDLASLLLDLSHNPATRRDIGKLVKKAKPESPHAAAFADVEIEDKFESFKEEQAQKDIERQRNAVLDRMNQQRMSLLNGGADGEGRKYSEDDVKKIEALMEKKGLTDYEDAAILYAATLPPPSPQPPTDVPKHGATWEFPEWDAFSKDPVKASRNIASQVIHEFQQRKRA